MLNMALCMLLPLLTISTWLSISMYATAVSMHTTVSENRQPSKCVQSPRVMQTCVILVSLLSITASLTMFIFTQVHCMLTLTAAYSFLAQPHWISACLILLYAPKAIDKLTIRLTHVIEYAIQSLVKDPKKLKFAHPRIRNGTYWRRIRNRTRRLHKQLMCRYTKVLCWLQDSIQWNAKPQQRTYSEKHASKSGDEHHTYMQGEAKCDKPHDAALISWQSERRMQDKATKSACIYWGGGQKSEKQGQNEADNETYLPFSTTTEWLSNNHIMHCTLYLLHMQYPNAKHQNMTGVTHSVVQHNELLFKVTEASGHVPMTSQSDIAGTLRETLSRNGPSPAIVVGDGIHWRIILTDARSQTVAFIDPFGSGLLQDIIAAIKTFYDNEQPGRWQYKEWTTRLQQRGDTWICGIWAIWIQEKWMQYWSQNEVTNTFESWFQDNNRTVPAGQDLREHYHAVMQVANRVVQNSRNGFAISRSIAASRWQTDAQRPTEVLDSPDIHATGNGRTQSKKVATTRLHRTLGNSLSRLHTSTRMHGKIHKKPKPTHTASAGRLLSWLQGKSNTKDTGKVQYDRNDAGMQHNSTSSTASCKLPPPDHSRHAHKPGSIQACFANATLKENAPKQQLAPGKPPAKDNITVDKEMHLQQEKIDSDCSISLGTTRKARKARQASTLSETCRAGMTSHTNKKPATTQEKKRKVAGAYTPCCDTLTVLTWNVMGSTTVPDELMQTAQQRKPWIIVLTETKLTDARQDRVFFQEYLPEYTLFHSCVKGNASGHCRTGSGGVAIAVHKSLTSQNSVELIDHNNPAAESHLKTLRIKTTWK